VVTRWLARHGLSDALAADPSADARDSDALAACAHAAVQIGLFERLDGVSPLAPRDHDEPAHAGRYSVSLDGFKLHAAVVVGADEDVSRERLVRYCSRPAFALERLSVLPDGRIAYQQCEEGIAGEALTQ